MIPKRLPVSRKGSKNALRSLHINVSRFRIDGWTRCGVSMVNDVTEEIAEAILPEFFPGFCVEANEDFLKVRPVPEIAHEINFAFGDHWSGLSRYIRRPERFLNRDFVRQVLFGGGAALLWSTPTQPAARGSSFQTRGGEGS